MARRRPQDLPPRAYAVPDTGTWPDCRIAGPAWAHAAATLARRLRAAQGSRSMREVGRLADVDANVLARILRGESWPDGLQAFKLCLALDVDLLSEDDRRRYAAIALVGRFCAWAGVEWAAQQPVEVHPAWRPRIGVEVLQPDIYIPQAEAVVLAVSLRGSDWMTQANRAVEGLQVIRQVTDLAATHLAVLAPTPLTASEREWLLAREVIGIYPDGKGFSSTDNGLLLQRITE